jgi:ubiquinone/menaquinone biosynthesis C-methylase UbiE
VNQYIFDNAAPQAAQRFTSLEVLYDPSTIRHFEAVGIGEGWHCLEVGGGSGSIAAWLAGRVSPTGHVLVTDIDPRHLTSVASLGYPQLEIQRHDIGSDPLPKEAYDLIHARLVLVHVPAREPALTKMAAALKPGGWLVVEDFDSTLIDRGFSIRDEAARAVYQKMLAAQFELMTAHGSSINWGRQLYTHFCAQGLSEVGMEGQLAMRPGGSVGAQLDRANFEQVRDEAVACGLITKDEAEQILTILDDPQFAASSPVMMTAWGRRPA